MTMPHRDKNYRIGLLIESIHEPCQALLWKGIDRWASDNNITTISYVASSEDVNSLNRHFSMIKDFVKNNPTLDGLILFSGALLEYEELSEIERFCSEMIDIPVISIAAQLPNTSSITVENSTGIIDMITHIYRDHKRERIAFVKGPDGHSEAEERFSAYREALSRCGLPYNEELVLDGHFREDSGRAAVQHLIKNSTRFDAIFAVDDVTAFGVLLQLKEYKINVPTDVSVGSFDNVADSSFTSPPLSTVSQPFYEEGVQAIRHLIERIEGSAVATDFVIPTVPLLRRSCGCFGEVTFFPDPPLPHNDSSEIITISDALLPTIDMHLSEAFHQEEISLIRENIIRYIKGAVNGSSDLKALLTYLDISIANYSTTEIQFIALIDLFSLFTLNIPNIFPKQYRAIANTLLQNVTNFLSQHLAKHSKSSHIEANKKSRAIRETSQRLIATLSYEKMTDVILHDFPKLGIDEFYFFVYGDGDGKMVQESHWELPKQSRLVVGYNNEKKYSLSDTPIIVDNPDISIALGGSERKSLIFMPLFFEQLQLGFIIFKRIPRHEEFMYEEIRLHLSSALRSFFTLHEMQIKNKELQAEKERANKLAQLAHESNRIKGDFLANMSHDIRTPMNGVVGLTNLLLKTSLDNEQMKYSESILSSANSLLSLINDILDFSKIDANKLEIEEIPFNLNHLLVEFETITQFRANDEGVDYSWQASDDLPLDIISDPSRLRQILTNLVGNAIKFTEEGSVQLNCSVAERSDDSALLKFEVTDSGIGIDKKKLKILFDSFTQVDASMSRKFGGTGLGLAISKKLCTLLGGEIGVESTLGEGSTFTFTIRTKINNEQKPQININTLELSLPKSPERTNYSAKILLVEDNRINQMVALGILKKLGYDRVDTAENGVLALKKLANKQFNLVLMDCQMPEMDGFEATQEIRKLPCDMNKVPIIAMTANAMDGDREKCLSVGMNDYLSKPIDPQLFGNKLREWV